MTWELWSLVALGNGVCFVIGYWSGIANCKRIVEEEFQKAKRDCMDYIDETEEQVRRDLRLVRPGRLMPDTQVRQ